VTQPEEIIRWARNDLAVYGLRVAGQVRIDWAQKHTADYLGIYYAGKSPIIWLNPALTGAALYRVVLHELGHALGLEHKNGPFLMAPKRCQPVDFQPIDPTPTQRRSWSYEIAEAVLKLRRRLVAA
jgi:Zn-dependent peptidase ImmA (M78 family)